MAKKEEARRSGDANPDGTIIEIPNAQPVDTRESALTSPDAQFDEFPAGSPQGSPVFGESISAALNRGEDPTGNRNPLPDVPPQGLPETIAEQDARIALEDGEFNLGPPPEPLRPRAQMPEPFPGAHAPVETNPRYTCTLQVHCPLAGRYSGGNQSVINKDIVKLQALNSDECVFESEYQAAGYVVFIMHGYDIERMKELARETLLSVQGAGFFTESAIGVNGMRQSKRTPIEG